MDKNLEDTILETKILLSEVSKDLSELKNDTITKEAHTNLLERVYKIENNLSKVTWLVIAAVVGALLSLILKV